MANSKNKSKTNQKAGKKGGMGTGRVQSSSVSAMTNSGNRTVIGGRRAPVTRSTASGLIVSNTEIYNGVAATGPGNTSNKIGLNPADGNVFRWLSGLAKRYSYYRWKRLRVCFSSQASTSQNGQVELGLFYDREDLDAWFATTGDRFVELSQCQETSAGPVWGSTLETRGQLVWSQIGVEADVTRAHMRNNWLMMDGSVTNTALDNQSVGVFLGTCVVADGALLAGYIYLDYEIEFLHPAPASANATALLASRSLVDQNTRLDPAPKFPTGDTVYVPFPAPPPKPPTRPGPVPESP